jgi:hypothetical protein
MKIRKQLGNLTPEELCQEAISLREELESSVEYLNEIYTTLYTKVRRGQPTEESYTYISVASTGKRLSNVLSQAISRSFSVTGSLLTRSNREALERQEEVERKKRRLERKKAPKPVQDPLESLYGVAPTASTDIDFIGRYKRLAPDLGSSFKELYGEV